LLQGRLSHLNHKVLIIVENLPVPFDRRVWKEASSLHENGYGVTELCPRGKGYERRHEVIDGVRAACVRYLQNWLMCFYPERPDLVQKAEDMARELGSNWKCHACHGSIPGFGLCSVGISPNVPNFICRG
jgi:hypothetical protein